MWVDAAYLLPRDNEPGAVYFGGLCSFEFESRTGAVSCTGRNYGHDKHQRGRYKAHSSKVGDLRLTYTFDWIPKTGSGLILGCGSLMLNGPPPASGRLGAPQPATYGGSFFAEGLPKFSYEGRRLLPDEEDPELAGEVVAKWMDKLATKLEYPIATPEQLAKWFK